MTKQVQQREVQRMASCRSGIAVHRLPVGDGGAQKWKRESRTFESRSPAVASWSDEGVSPVGR